MHFVCGIAGCYEFGKGTYRRCQGLRASSVSALPAPFQKGNHLGAFFDCLESIGRDGFGELSRLETLVIGHLCGSELLRGFVRLFEDPLLLNW